MSEHVTRESCIKIQNLLSENSQAHLRMLRQQVAALDTQVQAVKETLFDILACMEATMVYDKVDR